MNNYTRETGIPILTEIIPSPVIAPNKVIPPSLTISENAIVHEIKPYFDEDEKRWAQLEQEIHKRTLHQILDRIDFVLEQRIRDSLAEVLETAVAHVASEIQKGLHHTIKEVVTHAVSQEIAKQRSIKN